jgi:hypothetical protein
MRGGIWLVVLASSVAIAQVAWAAPSEVERLRAENARLTARIHELEAQNARLAGQGAGPAAAALEETAKAEVRDEVDRDAGMITTATAPSELARVDGGRTRQWFTLRAARRDGEPVVATDGVTLRIETANTNGAYRRATDLQLSTDGTNHALRIADYHSEPISVGRTPTRVGEREIVVVSVPSDVLARMAEARDVRGTLGPLAFRLTPAQLASVRAFRQRIGA